MADLLKLLNSEQQKAVTHTDGPLLIVAGAGTGKTTVISQRIGYLIQEVGCRPEEILALTFTDKAAGEMEARVDQLLPYGYVDLWISTFHSFAERILQAHALEIGLSGDFKLLNTTSQWLLIRRHLDKLALDYYRPLGNPTKFVHALIKHFSRAKDENISPSEYLNYAENLKMNSDSTEFVKTMIDEAARKQLSKKELKEVLSQEINKQLEVADAYHVYQQLLLDNNFLDFGDLINYTLKLFQQRKNLLARYRTQFKYILVDEFQDTNYAQYELLKLLAAPNNNLTVVGDDDQSIYKFRGASIANILQFKKDFPRSQEVFLTTNYRNRQNILDLSYVFIQQNNPERLEVKLAAEKKLCKKLSAATSGLAEILHLHGQTAADEAGLVAKKIINLYNQSQENSWSDFAILVRANSSADIFTYVLNQARIPFNFVASKGLYSKDIVLDILAYLKLLDNYHEGPALYRVLSWPLWQLSQAEVVNFNYWAKRKGQSLYEILRQAAVWPEISASTQKKAANVLGLIEKHSQLAKDKKTTEIIQAFLADTGYLKELTSADTAVNREKLNYLNQFYKKVGAFEKENQTALLKDFMELMELELAAGEEGGLQKNWEEEGPDTVKIMTIHAAKGLEFKYVFIVNLVYKRFPSICKNDPIELPAKLIKEAIPDGDIHLQEERRLMYVDMTRAKQGLYLTSAADYGGARDKKLSRFLTELSQYGLELSKESRPAEKDNSKNEPMPSRPVIKEKAVLPAKFSFTQIKAFESCPYQYRFAHILKVPTKGNKNFSFGKTMHATLQQFFQLINTRRGSAQASLFGEKQQLKTSPDELLKIYQKCFIDDWYASRREKEEYYEKGREALKEFYQKHSGSWPVALYLEHPFNLKIKGQKQSYSLFGVVDRIDRLGEGLKIVDYKTGQPKTKLTAEEKEQLLIYQLAAQAVLKEPVKELAFYYLENNQEVSFLGSAKELDNLQVKIIGTIEEIKRGEFPPKPSQLCHYCDFRDICDYREN